MTAQPSKQNDEPLRQPDMFERIGFGMTSEMLSLAHDFSEAAVKLEAARVAKSFAAVRSAYLDIVRFTDQAAMLNEGLQKAIEGHNGSNRV